MKNVTLFFILLFFMSSFAFAGNKAAIVKIVKGEAFLVSGKSNIKLKLNDWIEAGATIKTSKKSFIKLVFIDKSQMNIGPSSEIKVARFDRKDAGVIDLVRGKIRSQVSKDYLQIDGKNRSKLFIKTPNAVMGIRGTDFLISTTGKNTAAILFEGSVVFNRLTDRKLLDSAKLDDIVDRGVRMFPGEFSAVGGNGAPTIPALLNVQQREKLEKNRSFVKNNKSIGNSRRSIVPAGLSGSVVSSKPSIDLPKKDSSIVRASSNPDYFEKNGQIKPANGSFVLIDTAQVIQPGQDAVLDEATNTYVASSATGEVKLDGSFAPVKELAEKIDVSLNEGIRVDAPVVDAEVANSPIVNTSRSGGTGIIDASASTGSAVINTGSTVGAASAETISSINTGVLSPVTSPSSGTTQSVQIGDSLNDAIKAAPVVGSAAGDTLDPATDAIDKTSDGALDATKKALGGVNRLIDKK